MTDDLPYGPGQSDYEYDKQRQRKVDMEPKLCKECRYIRPAVAESLAVCAAPLAQPAPDLVWGKPRETFCEFQRGLGNKCGPEARLFELLPKVEVIQWPQQA